MVEGVVVWGGIAVFAALLGGILAHWKNRSYSTWIGWCFIVPPAVIVLLLLPVLPGERPKQPTLDDLDRHTGGGPF